jgi:hypothetical protein
MTVDVKAELLTVITHTDRKLNMQAAWKSRGRFLADWGLGAENVYKLFYL